MEDSKFSISNKTKGKLPRLPFAQIKERVLGKKYELSLVFTGDRVSRRLNRQYRGKDKPTNVLSFNVTETTGEIFINLRQVKRETKKFGEKYENLVGFLFIHGLLHLKGLEHGSTMERAEKKLRKQFKI